jgi:hypothetical protein
LLGYFHLYAYNNFVNIPNLVTRSLSFKPFWLFTKKRFKLESFVALMA